MGKKPRNKPQQLAAKLLAIRQNLGISQVEMAQRLNFRYYTRLSEYESGRREPNLLILLAYEACDCSVEQLIDDTIQWP
jgi:transcriptional regulator with XRE-family HTH domain